MKLNWAERWVVNNPTRVFQQHIEIKWLQQMMPLKAGATILEVGCGRGAGAKLIHRAFKPSQLHILDLDIKMIQGAKTYLSGTTKDMITMYVGDSIDLPFKSDTLDALFGFGFLHHVPNWRRALSEIARVLKSGGVYYMEELYPSLYQNVITKRILLHPEHDRFTSKDLQVELDAAGLSLINSFELKKMGILGVAIKSDGIL
ncbi:MAG: class I SAM-dependent methyltransferase [Desulfobacteraceae bacterium]|nr:class I SAM-dependent methyltransferase [Desulfobacteraceae bacterium]MDH3575173.1 class I SAM-dependent methyltransferase [Desulfobacteraceae bacterium]MDH3722673.1 class I SAM-dependent methyltransferase [Desulfobacteraceae bacterium]MDH3837821.1 class I SAM-dependent methyltransferase [Desulfobacteraceae bacterium]MDH3874882.1 class I SAM-dependent methyltransferase [Desulfobacteraceae bacterium]